MPEPRLNQNIQRCPSPSVTNKVSLNADSADPAALEDVLAQYCSSDGRAALKMEISKSQSDDATSNKRKTRKIAAESWSDVAAWLHDQRLFCESNWLSQCLKKTTMPKDTNAFEASYCWSNPKEGRAQIVGGSPILYGISHERCSDVLDTLAQFARATIGRRENGDRCTGISFVLTDQGQSRRGTPLTDREACMASAWHLARLGIDPLTMPWYATRHDNTNQPHWHVQAGRVRPDGSVIDINATGMGEISTVTSAILRGGIGPQDGRLLSRKPFEKITRTEKIAHARFTDGSLHAEAKIRGAPSQRINHLGEDAAMRVAKIAQWTGDIRGSIDCLVIWGGNVDRHFSRYLSHGRSNNPGHSKIPGA